MLARLIDTAASIYILLIIGRAIISWFSPDPYNPLVQFLYKSTEPLLERIRRFIPTPGIDFSPFIAILLIQFVVRGFIVNLLHF